MWVLLLAWLAAADEAWRGVTLGSVVALEHKATGYRLHSHEINWGSGSGQQSVTAFHGDGDPNSLWLVYEAGSGRGAGSTVACGETVRLRHVRSGAHLHSHLHTSPLSKQQEVSGFKDESNTDDHWIVECSGSIWERGTPIVLRHASTGTYLGTSAKHKFNQSNCRNCPIQGQLEVHAKTTKTKGAQWTTAQGIYFPANE